jgi:hypothetical protein
MRVYILHAHECLFSSKVCVMILCLIDGCIIIIVIIIIIIIIIIITVF